MLSLMIGLICRCCFHYLFIFYVIVLLCILYILCLWMYTIYYCICCCFFHFLLYCLIILCMCHVWSLAKFELMYCVDNLYFTVCILHCICEIKLSVVQSAFPSSVLLRTWCLLNAKECLHVLFSCALLVVSAISQLPTNQFVLVLLMFWLEDATVTDGSYNLPSRSSLLKSKRFDPRPKFN